MNKQQALDLFEQKRVEVLHYARWVARRVCQSKGWVTVDDVRECVSLPEGIDARALGAIFNKDEWVKTGYTSTTGRPVAVFTHRWLTEAVKNAAPFQVSML